MNKIGIAKDALEKMNISKETLDKTKNLIVDNKNNIIKGVILLLIIGIYFIFFYNRVDRYLSKMEPLKNIINIQPINSIKEYISRRKNYRLCDFYIASSFKSYLPCTNYYDYAHTDAIKQALIYGARYIDLDVFNKTFEECTEPVVCSGRDLGNWHYTNRLSLEECCDTISKLAFSNIVPGGSDPLFINLNLNLDYNIYTMNKISKILIKFFSHKFMDKKYTYLGINENDPIKSTNIMTAPLYKLINKVIIICDQDVSGSDLEEIVNISATKRGNLRQTTYFEIKQTYDAKEITEYNRKNMTRVIPMEGLEYRTKKNINYATPWYMGCQFICMNYTKPDEYMAAYLERFKNTSFVLKPYKLRYHPTLIRAPEQQIKEVSFAPERVSTPSYSITY